MYLFIDLVLALSFISRLPVRVRYLEDFQDRIKRIPRYFTLIGYLPGIVYFLSCAFAENTVLRIAGIAIGFYFFDLFHFDGLLDMLDGFLNQSSKEKRLEIMSKGDVGPFAVFYGTLFVLAFYDLFRLVKPIDFLFASVFGRYTMTTLISISKPAKGTGLGALFFPPNRVNILVSGTFLIPLLFFGPVKFALCVGMSVAAAVLVKVISHRKISGVTGDVIGGSCLISQMLILMVLYLSEKWG